MDFYNEKLILGRCKLTNILSRIPGPIVSVPIIQGDPLPDDKKDKRIRIQGSLVISLSTVRYWSSLARNSTISASGSLFAYSEHVKPSLFELKSAHGEETMDLLITKTGNEMEKDSIVVEKDRKLEREFGVPRKCEGFELEITWVEEEHCLYEYDASQGLGMDGFAATKFNDSSHLNNPNSQADIVGIAYLVKESQQNLQWFMKELEVGTVQMKEQVAAVGHNADLFNLESLCYVNPAAQWLVFGPRIEVTLDQRVE
uniref:Uncharacterized protein n=1 Tax=Vitis vinifera TaxID=29760 RepID=A5B0D8_VITVI|nr:hypothetical protein VITISV_024629 [Vitis vinifera]